LVTIQLPVKCYPHLSSDATDDNSNDDNDDDDGGGGNDDDDMTRKPPIDRIPPLRQQSPKICYHVWNDWIEHGPHATHASWPLRVESTPKLKRILSFAAVHNITRFHENRSKTFCIIVTVTNKRTLAKDYNNNTSLASVVIIHFKCKAHAKQAKFGRAYTIVHFYEGTVVKH